MSDTTEMDSKPADQLAPDKQPEPKTAPKKDEGSGYDAAFKSLQSEKARLEGELTAAQRKLAERDRELGEFKGKVEGYVKREREGSIIAKIKAARPDLSDLNIRGQLAIFAEEGRVDRFGEDADTASKTALELINEHSPPSENKRPPAQGGGPGGAPQQPRQPNALRSLFGMK